MRMSHFFSGTSREKSRKAYFCQRVLMWQSGGHLFARRSHYGLSVVTPAQQLVQKKAILSECSLGTFSISAWKRNMHEAWSQTLPAPCLQDLPVRAGVFVQNGWFCHLVAFSSRLLQVCAIVVSARQLEILRSKDLWHDWCSRSWC